MYTNDTNYTHGSFASLRKPRFRNSTFYFPMYFHERRTNARQKPGFQKWCGPGFAVIHQNRPNVRAKVSELQLTWQHGQKKLICPWHTEPTLQTIICHNAAQVAETVVVFHDFHRIARLSDFGICHVYFGRTGINSKSLISSFSELLF